MVERDFKGVWIPKEIYLDSNLNWTEKIILIEIDSLDGENGCFASNDHFAKHLMISKDRAGKIINKLVQERYITREIIYKKGTKQIEKRILHSTIGYSRKQLESIVENNYTPIVKNNQDNNTIINNTNNNTTTTSSDSDFNILKYAEQRNFILSAIQIQQLLEDVNQYSLSEVKKALDIADDNGVRKYSYYKSVLERRRSGAEQKKKSDEEFEEMKRKAANGEDPF